MKVYLVRHIETKEVQGIFWGALDDIWDALDELCDPYGFEYAALKPGALYTRAIIGEGKAAVQYDEMEDEDGDWGFSWSGFEPNGSFWEALHDQSGLKWHSFDPATKGYGLVARIANRNAASD
jgi:hypothetical protein